MPTVRYFAYGSNMLTARLRERCPSVVPLTVAEAKGFGLEFRKRGRDGSGKATLVRRAGGAPAALGVVFEVARDELAALDRIEGSGYRRLSAFEVSCLRSGVPLTAHTYTAIEIHSGLQPFGWYLALLIAGIAEHGLGETYAARLRSSRSVADEERERAARDEALRAFREAGVEDYAALLIGPRADRRQR